MDFRMYGYHCFSNSHYMYLHSVITPYIGVFLVSGSVCLSRAGFRIFARRQVDARISHDLEDNIRP